ncbi:MAG: glycerol-3-phosphate 1-O-acyltransferase PlsY [Planctomycetaceae bacterium]
MLVIFLASYLCGSIPFGLVIVRLVSGKDLRQLGSGNIGATNAGRVLGKTWGLIILLLDALKGAGPALAAPWLAEQTGATLSPQSAQVLAAVGAILGHMFPVWLGFRGGKGVATALGVILVLAPWGTLIAAAVFAVSFAAKRIVSLSSILAAISFGAYQLWVLSPQPFGPESRSLAVFSVAIPLLIIVRHRANIARLLQGTEPTFRSNSVETKATPSGIAEHSTSD